MRAYFHIDLNAKSATKEEQSGETLARGGRYLIAKTLMERGVAKADPLGPGNPLIFSAGPFAGTNFSNANRISVGCKSPLTGGVKESNAGGTLAFAMGQCGVSGFTLNGQSDDWVVIRVTKEHEVIFEPADEYLGKGNFEVAGMLHEKYGKKVALGICGPVGEWGGLIAGISFTDPEGRPVRISARGGVGAVMGSKKVKAIVVDRHKMPKFHDRKKLMSSVKDYGAKLNDDPAIQNLNKLGTALVADVINYAGGIPVRNFSSGQMVDPSKNTLFLGGAHIRERNLERGGEPTHACMPGCMISCSNVYADKDGNEMVSPLEYETLGLMGSNCGLTDPDDVAILNNICNDLGVDTIETGAALAVMMDAGLAEFGDTAFMQEVLDELKAGAGRGRILAMGAARAGAHYQAARVPAIKRQAISAYDPRVIEVTGISMMLTAQGADHTTGNLPTYECAGKSTEELVEASMDVQTLCAAVDSIGLCVFGRSVTNINHPLIIGAMHDALGAHLPEDFLIRMGRETLMLEDAFNHDAGFRDADNDLPDFFFKEELAPTNKIARHDHEAVTRLRGEWYARHKVPAADEIMKRAEAARDGL